MVSTHIYGAFEVIDGKLSFFTVNIGMWALKTINLEKQALSWGFSTHIYCVYKDIGGKMFIFQLNLVMWPLKLNISEKQTLFWGFQHTFMGFLMRWMGKCSFLE